MAMFAPIPLPGIDNPQFKDVMDFWQQLNEMKMKRPLLEAQTQEAQANALKSKMFANLMNAAFGGDYQLSPQEKERVGQMKPGESVVVGKSLASSDSSSAERAKQMLYSLGFLKETPQEQTAREETSKIAAEQRAIKNRILTQEGTEGVKSGFDIKKSARSLANTADLVDQLDRLLEKNPHLTGVGAGVLNKFNISKNPELGKFITTAGKLQAEIGRYASQRGGIQSVKWAQSVKPSEWKDVKFNKGMLDAIREQVKDEYSRLRDEFRDTTGKELPIEINSTSNGDEGIIKWKLVNGKLIRE